MHDCVLVFLFLRKLVLFCSLFDRFVHFCAVYFHFCAVFIYVLLVRSDIALLTQTMFCSLLCVLFIFVQFGVLDVVCTVFVHCCAFLTQTMFCAFLAIVVRFGEVCWC